MDNREKELEFFSSTPPRLFPHLDYQRPIIESLLAQTAATDKDKYEDRFEVFNKMCDEYNVPRFARVTVVYEQAAPTDSSFTTVPVTPEADVSNDTVTGEVTVKKSKKAKSSPSEE